MPASDRTREAVEVAEALAITLAGSALPDRYANLVLPLLQAATKLTLDGINEAAEVRAPVGFVEVDAG